MVGATEIALAVRLRREIKGEWFLILMGLASIAFAFLLLWNPVAGAAAVIWIIAWYAVILGVLGLFLAFGCAAYRHCPCASQQKDSVFLLLLHWHSTSI